MEIKRDLYLEKLIVENIVMLNFFHKILLRNLADAVMNCI